MVATNINGMLETVHSLLAGMLQRDEGHIVLLGSIAGDYPLPAGNVYGASKAFVKQFALNLRADVLDPNVRVTNIEPGLTDTDFMLVRFGGDAEKKERFNQGLTPMTAEDIAEAIFWSSTLPRNVNINRIQMMPITRHLPPVRPKRRAYPRPLTAGTFSQNRKGLSSASEVYSPLDRLLASGGRLSQSLAGPGRSGGLPWHYGCRRLGQAR